MSTNLTVNGVTYPYPTLGDQLWGTAATNWAVAVTSGMLQKAGGNFTLTADANFGANYGLLSQYFTSRTANPASAGNIRLAKTDTIKFRNNANSADLALAIDGSDNFTFGGTKIILSGAIVNADVSNSAAISYSKLALTGSILNADLAGSIAYSKLSLSGAILNTDLAGSIADGKLASSYVYADGSRGLSGNWAAGAHSATFNSTIIGGSAGTVDTSSGALTLKSAGTTVASLVAAGASFLGTNTNDSASSGYVGEYIESSQSTFTNFTGSTGQWGDGPSISLTAGDWDVNLSLGFTLNGAGSAQNFAGGIGTVSGNTSPGNEGIDYVKTQTPSSGNNTSIMLIKRVSISSTTTIYSKVFGTYGSGNPQFIGHIWARRRR